MEKKNQEESNMNIDSNDEEYEDELSSGVRFSYNIIPNKKHLFEELSLPISIVIEPHIISSFIITNINNDNIDTQHISDEQFNKNKCNNCGWFKPSIVNYIKENKEINKIDVNSNSNVSSSFTKNNHQTNNVVHNNESNSINDRHNMSNISNEDYYWICLFCNNRNKTNLLNIQETQNSIIIVDLKNETDKQSNNKYSSNNNSSNLDFEEEVVCFIHKTVNSTSTQNDNLISTPNLPIVFSNHKEKIAIYEVFMLNLTNMTISEINYLREFNQHYINQLPENTYVLFIMNIKNISFLVFFNEDDYFVKKINNIGFDEKKIDDFIEKLNLKVKVNFNKRCLFNCQLKHCVFKSIAS